MRLMLAVLAALATAAPVMAQGTLADEVGGCLGAPPERTIDADPSTYRNLLLSLGPGDRLRLGAGTYAQGLPISGLVGQPGRCIVVEGPSSGAPAIIRPPASLCCNTVAINDSSYVALRHLEIDSQGLDGIDGIKAESGSTSTHHINLEDLYVHGQGGSQQTVGISTKCPSWNWVVRRCTIVGAGTGLYLGNSDGSAELVASLVERNLVRDTIGYNMQIKHQNGRSTGIGAPASGVTTIRHNVFSKAGSTTSPPDGARPNLLVGHWPLTGPGSTDHYEIYGNFFYQNALEALFQGTGNIAFYANVLVNDFDLGANFQFHEGGNLRQVEVFHNTIVSASTGINVTGVEAGFDQRVRGNAVFATGAGGTALNLAGGVAASDNVTDAYGSAGAYLANPTASVGAGLDLFPLVGTLQGPVLDTTGLAGFRDWDRDFDDTPYDLAFRGAYSGEGTNPGWPLALEIKPEPPAMALSISDATPVGEAAAGTLDAVFTVTLSPAASAPVGVAWSTAAGTAQAGADYTAASGLLSFAPGETSQTLAVGILDDALDEDDETFSVTLSSPSGAEVADGAGLATIADDDAPPALSIGDATIAEGWFGVFPVTLSEASGRSVTVGYVAEAGTATPAIDFRDVAGTLALPPGATTAAIRVFAFGDRIQEADETFTVTLSGATNATIADGTGAGTIHERVPALSLDCARVREGRAALFTVRLSARSPSAVTLTYATVDGTAAGGSDYVAATGRLTLPVGATTRTIRVWTLPDAGIEGSETFFLDITASTGATVLVSRAQGTILDASGP